MYVILIIHFDIYFALLGCDSSVRSQFLRVINILHIKMQDISRNVRYRKQQDGVDGKRIID
jgi:hypothetical protein